MEAAVAATAAHNQNRATNERITFRRYIGQIYTHLRIARLNMFTDGCRNNETVRKHTLLNILSITVVLFSFLFSSKKKKYRFFLGYPCLSFHTLLLISLRKQFFSPLLPLSCCASFVNFSLSFEKKKKFLPKSNSIRFGSIVRFI